jgi:two-component system CheB/CheR fusion protein
MWGLRPGEVQGRNFLTLDIGLPVERLKQPIRATLNGDGWHEKLSLPATNRRGKAILCEISCTPLRREGIVKAGAILMMTETPHDGRA